MFAHIIIAINKLWSEIQYYLKRKIFGKSSVRTGKKEPFTSLARHL